MATPGRLAVPNEVDNYTVHLEADTPYIAEVNGASAGPKSGYTLDDPFVSVGDLSTGSIIAIEDNSPGGNPDPRLDFQVPVSGNYIVSVGSVVGDTGTYSVGVYDENGDVRPGSFFTEFVLQPILPQVGMTGLPNADNG